MKIAVLRKPEDLSSQPKLNETIIRFNELLNELKNRDFPDDTLVLINKNIAELNTSTETGNGLRKLFLKKQSGIIKLLEKRHKIVPKNHYRNLWMILGMFIFGIPIGVSFGAGTHHLALMSMGYPIGLAIGIALGTGLDKKAFNEGRQLQTALKIGLC